MERVVELPADHSRLDACSPILRHILRRSEIIRQAIRAPAGIELGPGERVIIGLGASASGNPNLGSDKKHLGGFGRW